MTRRAGETRLLPDPLKFIGRSRMVYWRAVSGPLNVPRKKAVSSMKFSRSYLEMDQRSILSTASFFIINPFIFPLNAISSNFLQCLKKNIMPYSFKIYEEKTKWNKFTKEDRNCLARKFIDSYVRWWLIKVAKDAAHKRIVIVTPLSSRSINLLHLQKIA